jgi:hypothetical protein
MNWQPHNPPPHPRLTPEQHNRHERCDIAKAVRRPPGRALLLLARSELLPVDGWVAVIFINSDRAANIFPSRR